MSGMLNGEEWGGESRNVAWKETGERESGRWLSKRINKGSTRRGRPISAQIPPQTRTLIGCLVICCSPFIHSIARCSASAKPPLLSRHIGGN